MSSLSRIGSFFHLLSAAHRVRIALDDVCAFDEYVFHEVMLLRALSATGAPMSGVELARALGWSGGRVSTVVKSLLAKEMIARAKHPNRRCRAVKLTDKGFAELRSAEALVDTVAAPTLETFDGSELAAFAGLIHRVAERSAMLWRHRRPDAIDGRD